MTSKERVYSALQRQPTNRVPIFMWYHPQAAARPARLLEIPAQYVPVAMGDDIHQTWVHNNYAMEAVVHERDGDSHVDEWGIEWTRIGGFNQISGFPLAEQSKGQVLEYGFPSEWDRAISPTARFDAGNQMIVKSTPPFSR